jgi:hypothetical protein
MAKFLTGRQKNLKVGIASYSENITSLEVIGKVGIGSTVPSSSLDVVGNSDIKGNLKVSESLEVSGISTFNNINVINQSGYAIDISGISTFDGKVSISSVSNDPVALEVFGDANFSNFVGIVTATIDYLTVQNLDLSSLQIGSATSITIADSSGEDGQYLRSTGVGVTWADFPSLRTGFSTVGVSSQTTVQTIYNTDFVDVFLNGVLLNSSEYTAINGIDIVFNDELEGGEIIDVFSYNTVSTFSGGGGGTTVVLGGSSLWISNLSNTGIYTSVNVGVGTDSDPTSALSVSGDTNITGVVTAFGFVGDGSGLTNIISTGSGVEIRDSGSVVGTASTIDFGSNISVSPISAGIVTISASGSAAGNTGEIQFNDGNDSFTSSSLLTFSTLTNTLSAANYSGNGSLMTGIVTSVSAGSGITITQTFGRVTIGIFGEGGYWNQNSLGISTTSNVGIGTTTSTSKLTVDGDGYFSGIVTANQFTTQTGGTPTIQSPNDLNISANTVAISTNLTVGNSVVANGGFISLGSTTPVQIFVEGTQLIFSVAGIGSTSFTLY